MWTRKYDKKPLIYWHNFIRYLLGEWEQFWVVILSHTYKNHITYKLYIIFLSQANKTSVFDETFFV